MAKNGKKWKEIVLVVILVIVGILYYNDKMEKERLDFNVCKRTIYEEDYIGKNCDRFFKNDKWYKDYMKIVDKEYKKLKEW